MSIEAMKLAQDLRSLADRFSEGWHDGIKIDASDIMLLATAAEAIEQAEKQEPVIECDCKTKISPDGTKTTRCGSDQMRRACEGGHAFSWQTQKQEPVVGTKTWFEDGKVITQKLYSRDIYNTYLPQRQPLTDEQEYEAIGTAGNDLLELAKLWADNEIHVYQFDNEARKIIKAVLHRAYGIKENQPPEMIEQEPVEWDGEPIRLKGEA